MSRLEKLQQVLNHPVMAHAYLSACKYRQINEKDRTVGGKRVGHIRFACTQRMIAEIVYDNHHPI